MSSVYPLKGVYQNHIYENLFGYREAKNAIDNSWNLCFIDRHKIFPLNNNLCLQTLKINFLVAAIAHVMLKINGFLLTMNNHVINCHFLN